MRTRLLLVVAVLACLAAGAAAGAALTPRRSTSSRWHGPSPVTAPPVSPLVVTSSWGRRGFDFHSGVDLRAREGAAVRSVGAGVVEKTARGGRGGLRVIVKLDSGWRVGYAHLSRVDVKEGQRVDAGSIVGLAGATGHATGPHLHLEMRDPKSKRLVDPWPHLKGRTGAGARGPRV